MDITQIINRHIQIHSHVDFILIYTQILASKISKN